MKYEVCLYIVKDKLYNQIENSSRVNYNIRSLCHLVKNQRATARATTICWQPRRNSQVTKKKKILYHLLAWKILPFYYFCFYKILILIITYNHNAIFPEMDVILLVLINISCAFYPKHAINPGTYSDTDQEISLKSNFIYFKYSFELINSRRFKKKKNDINKNDSKSFFH